MRFGHHITSCEHTRRKLDVRDLFLSVVKGCHFFHGLRVQHHKATWNKKTSERINAALCVLIKSRKMLQFAQQTSKSYMLVISWTQVHQTKIASRHSFSLSLSDITEGTCCSIFTENSCLIQFCLIMLEKGWKKDNILKAHRDKNMNVFCKTDTKQWTKQSHDRAQELRESQGGHHGLPVPNKPYGFCGRKAALNGTCPPVPPWSLRHRRVPVWDRPTGPRACSAVVPLYKEARTQHWPKGAMLADKLWGSKKRHAQDN